MGPYLCDFEESLFLWIILPAHIAAWPCCVIACHLPPSLLKGLNQSREHHYCVRLEEGDPQIHHSGMVRAWERFEVQLFPSPLPHQLHLAEIKEPIQVERGTLD